MPAVANYYYQSPYIADAARNLASALAPEDPDKALATQYTRYKFSREQELAKQQDTDRASRDEADKFLGELEGMQPVIDPTTGKIDLAATDAKARTLGNAVLEKGGREYYTAVDKATGTASPQYAAQQATLKAKADYLAQRDARQAGFTINLQTAKDTAAGERNDATNANRLAVQRLRNEGNLAVEYERYKRRNAGAVKILPAATVKQLIGMIDSFEEDSGAKMSQENYAKVLDLAAAETLRTGNPAGAVVSVWGENAPTVDEVSEGDSWVNAAIRAMGHNPTDPQLVPHFKVPPATGPTNLGTPVAPDAAAASAPVAPAAAAPVSEDPPPAALARLKEGFITTFANGQKWTLEAGRPKRVQ